MQLLGELGLGPKPTWHMFGSHFPAPAETHCLQFKSHAGGTVLIFNHQNILHRQYHEILLNV